jgi:hypothetical protein
LSPSSSWYIHFSRRFLFSSFFRKKQAHHWLITYTCEHPRPPSPIYVNTVGKWDLQRFHACANPCKPWCAAWGLNKKPNGTISPTC